MRSSFFSMVYFWLMPWSTWIAKVVGGMVPPASVNLTKCCCISCRYSAMGLVPCLQVWIFPIHRI